MPVVHVRFEVEQNYDGWRLDRYLQQKIPRLSRQKIQTLIRLRLECEGRRLKPASIVTAGLRFHLVKDVDDEKESDAKDHVRVLHDDAELLVVDKPAKLAVHPSARYTKHTLTAWLAEHALGPDGVRPDLGHRLDRETSGVLVCGRGIVATRALKAAFANRKTEKTYLALCEGRVERDTQEITAPMRLTEKVKVVMEIHPDGMSSHTTVRVLRRGRLADGAGITLVECTPHTGRQHQIRVHLLSIGHPIIGDKIYGGGIDRFLRFCDGALTEEDVAALRIDRHALHAARLALPHPRTGERCVIEAPFPRDLQAFCDAQVRWDDEQTTSVPQSA